MMNLQYGTCFFLRKARGAMRKGETLSITFRGWRAKYISKIFPLLRAIELSFHNKHATQKEGGMRVLIDYVSLIVITPFMVIFWLAIGNGQKIEIKKHAKDLVEVIVIDMGDGTAGSHPQSEN